MTATIESTFLEALKAGPVLVLDNMHDKTHAATVDPLVDRSPLIKLALLAVDLGADPNYLSFNFRPPASKLAMRDYTAAVYGLQPDGPDMQRLLKSDAPALGFHWCELNRMWFVDEFVAHRKVLKASRAKDGNEHVRDLIVWINPQPAKFDRGNPKHMRVVERIHVHFNNQGWHTAAERLEKCMAPPAGTPTAAGEGAPLDPAYIEPTVAKYEQAFTVAGDIDPVKLASPISGAVDLAAAKARADAELAREDAGYTPPTDRASKTLRGELREALNRCSAENGSNTPDSILAELLVGTLAVFDHATRERDRTRAGSTEGRPSLVDREKFEVDLEALNRYLFDEHMATRPDGSAKVDPAALAPTPDESGPAAALRLLVLARRRGAFRPHDSMNAPGLTTWQQIQTLAERAGYEAFMTEAAVAPRRADDELRIVFRRRGAGAAGVQVDAGARRGVSHDEIDAALLPEQAIPYLRGKWRRIEAFAQSIGLHPSWWRGGGGLVVLSCERDPIAALTQIAAGLADAGLAPTDKVAATAEGVQAQATPPADNWVAASDRARAAIIARHEGADEGRLGSQFNAEVGRVVHLRNADNTGVRAWTWRLLGRPGESTAEIVRVVSSTASLTPDAPGSYLVGLHVAGSYGHEHEHKIVIKAGRVTASKRHHEVTSKQWTEISDLLRERKLDELLPFAERTLPKMVAAALDMLQKRAEMAAAASAHWQVRAETAEKMLASPHTAGGLTGYEKDLVEDAEKRAKCAEDESKIWHERWQAHENAIRDISKAYFEACLGPTPTNPKAIASALRFAGELKEKLAELAAADKEDHILNG